MKILINENLKGQQKALHIHTYIINWLLQPFSQNYNLVSHHLYIYTHVPFTLLGSIGPLPTYIVSVNFYT